MTSTQPEGDGSENSPVKLDRRTVLKSIALAATASGGGCLAAGRSDSRTEAPTQYLPDVDDPQFGRTERPDVYDLSYRWSHSDRRRQIDLSLSKERYRSATRAPRSVPRCFADAMNGDVTRQIAAELSRHIGSAGVESPVDRLRLATTFVRSFEYRRDVEDAGELEYPKYVEETLTENGGDCEDLAILLAGILSSPPFDLDVELLVFSNHVGLGVDPSSFAETVGPHLPVGGRKVLYVDATVRSPLGRVPPEYRDPGVIARYDGTWRIVDPAGLKEHIETAISNGTIDEFGNYV